MSYSYDLNLDPTYICRGTIIDAGDEVYVRGVSGKLLGIGLFAGSLVLLESDGTRVARPVLEVQGRLIAGADVDLWSPEAELIEAYRHEPPYPVADYISETLLYREQLQKMVDAALAAQIGIAL